MGYRVFCQKFDGYLNVDPGTMSPFQHGEVFVTEDGAETDLDLGHYERFLDTDLNRFSSFTSGKLYEEILSREREGRYLGGTVQIVPHLTDLVKEKIKMGFETSGADVSIVEIGGTVGDMENEYLLESARQLQLDLGRENVAFLHVTLLPYLGASKELKTKPTQHSVRTLMGYGISPDFLFLRADAEIPEDVLEKTAKGSGMRPNRVIPVPTADSIYRVPLEFESFGLSKKISEALSLPEVPCDLSKWEKLLADIEASKTELRIAMVGKYNDLEDAYFSLNEGLRTAGYAIRKKVKLEFVDATEVEKRGAEATLSGMDGICVPGGFGERGIEGMIAAAKYARENRVPYLGVCLGSQIMAMEFARNVLKIDDANSEEFAPQGKYNVVRIMETQKSVSKKGGTMRLGSYECAIRPGTLAHRLYGSAVATERHRHRFEFDPEYRERMEEKGFVVSAASPDGLLAEIVELRDHPFMVATQAHPEFKSRPTAPHPLFLGFVRAMEDSSKVS
jgi:CTP synthase